MTPYKLIPIAYTIANLSKDPATKVGCIILDDDCNILSTGFNGFPRGVNDSPERYHDRAVKLSMIVHAESNAIAQAARTGARLYDSILIVTAMYPCANCAKLIAQAGIKTVLAPPIDKNNTKWLEEWSVATTIFDEAGVKVMFHEP